MAEEPAGSHESAILFCGSWSLEALTLLPGSEKGDCDFCGASVVISVEGQKLMAKDPDVKVSCLSCGSKHAPDDTEITITPETRAEVESLLGKDPTEDLSGSAKDILAKLRQAEERKSDS
ncbi:MAG: hypothetical protein WBM00_07605 [Solirubrobacterales bacterium]